MPCTGPSIDYAHKLGEEIFAIFVEELRVKHHLTKNVTGGLCADIDQKQDNNFTKLEELIKDIVWTDHCFW